MSYKNFPQQLDAATTKAPSSVSSFGFVESSTLFKSTYAQLVEVLGTTGSISAVGSSSATAILTSPSSNVFNVAGIENGSGISVTTNAENGVEISANIINTAAVGSSVLKTEGADQLELRRIVGGTGITVSVDGDTILIELT